MDAPTTTRSTNSPPRGSEASSRRDTSRPARSIPAQLSMFDLTISETSPNAISSQALADGPTPSALPDGLTTGPSGPEAAHASHTARSVCDAATKIRETSGHPFARSSRSAALQSSLESRLRARMAAYGSPEYALIWKHWDMQSGPQISALRASPRRTVDSEFTGWVTPTTRDWKDTPGMAVKAGERTRLDQFPRQAAQYLGTASCRLLIDTETPVGANPALARWLLGFPPTWDACAPTETPWSRKSLRRS